MFRIPGYLVSQAIIRPCKSCLVVNCSIPNMPFDFSEMPMRLAMQTRQLDFSENKPKCFIDNRL